MAELPNVAQRSPAADDRYRSRRACKGAMYMPNLARLVGRPVSSSGRRAAPGVMFLLEQLQLVRVERLAGGSQFVSARDVDLRIAAGDFGAAAFWRSVARSFASQRQRSGSCLLNQS